MSSHHHLTEENSSSGNDTLIENWLRDRQALLVLYYKLCEMKPRSYTSLAAERLEAFRDLLVGYVSAGHFEVFEKIAASAENHATIILERSHMIALLSTTNRALDFYDKYDSNKDFQTLCDDLSELGVLLSTRFDLEDKLIDIYIEATDSQVLAG